MKVTTSTTGVRGAAHGVRDGYPRIIVAATTTAPLSWPARACSASRTVRARSFAAADVSAHHRGDTASNQRVPLLGRLWHCVHVGVYAAPLNYPPPPTTKCRGSTFCPFAGGTNGEWGWAAKDARSTNTGVVFAIHFPEFALNNVCTASTKNLICKTHMQHKLQRVLRISVLYRRDVESHWGGRACVAGSSRGGCAAAVRHDGRYTRYMYVRGKWGMVDSPPGPWVAHG